jgi:hypothetical protein
MVTGNRLKKTEEEGNQIINNRNNVNILLHEYDSLRQEILQKTNHIYQILALMSGALLAILNWFGSHSIQVIHLLPPTPIYLFCAELILAYGWAIIAKDIWKASTRIMEIEKAIDLVTGEKFLLRWERVWGGTATGILTLSRHIPKLQREPEDKDEGGS